MRPTTCGVVPLCVLVANFLMLFFVNVVYCCSYVEVTLYGNFAMWLCQDVVVSSNVVANRVVSSDIKT